jgi:mannobiose 2-epimerase
MVRCSERPLVGAIGRSARQSLRNELETELDRLQHVWFPRSVDQENGGFLCDFDECWRPSGPQHRMLEYQARQTIAAAQSAACAPASAFLREAASHGFRYLHEVMWDRGRGGWYRVLDGSGAPLELATKHGHGSAYAISACVACYELTGNPECLELAKSAFAWLDEHAHDSRYGGYFVFYEADGTPILSSDFLPGQPRDAIGTPIGFKDANTTSDLLKGFSDLYRVWPDPLLRKRLEEMHCILRDRLVVAPGVMHMYAHPDWTPLPDFVRYGQILRSANQLLFASETLAGAVEAKAAEVAKAMIDTMLRVAWDSNRGGFYLAGSSFGPVAIDGTIVEVKMKSWWVQADGMKALLTMARLHPDGASEYMEHFLQLWDYVKKHMIDTEHGGWFPAGLDTDPEAGRRRKASVWKDCSHEMEALLDCLMMIDSL